MAAKQQTNADEYALYNLEPFTTHMGEIVDDGFVASNYAMCNATESNLETNHPFTFDQKAIGILFRIQADGPFELRTPHVVLRSTPVCGRPTHIIHFAHGCPVGVLRYHKCEIVSTAAKSVSVLCYSVDPRECQNVFPDFSVFMWSPVTSSKSGRFQVFGTHAKSHGLMFMYGKEEEKKVAEMAVPETGDSAVDVAANSAFDVAVQEDLAVDETSKPKLWSVGSFSTHTGHVSKLCFLASSFAAENTISKQLPCSVDFEFSKEGIGILFRLVADGPFELHMPFSSLKSKKDDNSDTEIIHFPHGCPLGTMWQKICRLSSESIKVTATYYPIDAARPYEFLHTGEATAAIVTSPFRVFQALILSGSGNGLLYV
jgi:hypothetical protein